MNASPTIGATGELRFVVAAANAIDFADQRMPAVLSTPQVILHLEHAARRALEPVLEPGESSVGTQIEVQHLAPTPLGQEVVCRARVIHVDGATVAFQLEARDAHEVIARGLHRRAVIQIDRFAARVRRKSRQT